MISGPKINTEINVSRLAEFKSFLFVVSHHMALPLYFVFWLCDIAYVPHLKWQFLGLRSLIIPVVLVLPRLIVRASTLFEIQVIAAIFTCLISLPISIMSFWADGISSPYYAGLNLVAMGTLSFLPWSSGFFVTTVALIYGPYYVSGVVLASDLSKLQPLLINSFFVIGTITISILIRHFSEKLRQKETMSKILLEIEIEMRGKTIAEKTAEGVKLAALSSHFSPQIVSAIKLGTLDLSTTIHRANICSIFIDIVNSTERVVTLEQQKVHAAISLFMEDSIKTLLKYDITIDKFTGDGIVGFSNDPICYPDFIERVLNAAFEIRKKIDAKKNTYSQYWNQPLEIRIGIATGQANVGFYGEEKYSFRSYTAIGPVVNLASRLCSTAIPNQIVVCQNVVDKLKDTDRLFIFTQLSNRTLKGFDMKGIQIYDAKTPQNVNTPALPILQDENNCPNCEFGILFYSEDGLGTPKMQCRTCNYQTDSATTPMPLDRRAKAA